MSPGQEPALAHLPVPITQFTQEKPRRKELLKEWLNAERGHLKQWPPAMGLEDIT